MRSLVPVMKREYLQRVRSKWFVFATIAVPILMVGGTVGPIVLEKKNQETRRTIALVDETGVLSTKVASRLEEADFTVRRVDPGSEEGLSREVEEGELGGVLVLPPEALTRGRVEYHGKSRPGTVTGLTIRGIVAQSALEHQLAERGAAGDYETLLGGGELELYLQEKGEGGRVEDTPEFLGGFIGALLLYMIIILYAVAVMRATLEEKMSRVVEILISSVRPTELMLGKILGVGSVGLTQLGAWLLFGILAMTVGLPALLASRPELGDPEFILEALPDLGLSLLFIALFLGGYFLYSALYAAVGAMCSTEEEAQQAQFPVLMLMIPAVILIMPVIQDPNAGWAVAASLFPFFSPVLLYARANVTAVPLWQIGMALFLLVGGVLAVAWLAGRIYRVGILMQGKRPSLPELWRWVWEA